MELKHFRLIKTIVEEGSIANSSEKLFLTQSALSHRLRELEEQLGFKVFLRKRNNWKLTEQGQELYQMANNLFQTIEEGFGKIKYINEGSTGQIKIGTECYSFYRGLPTFIQEMAILYPQINVDIVIDATHYPVSKLISQEIDMAITTEKIQSADLMSCELYEDEVVCVMNRESRWAHEPFLQPSHFSNLHLIIHSFPLETVAVHTRFLKPNGITPQKITAIPFLSVVFEMVEVNMGVICLPVEVMNSFRLSDNIVLKRIGQNGLKRRHHLIYRKEDHVKQYIQDFIENIQEKFGERIMG